MIPHVKIQVTNMQPRLLQTFNGLKCDHTGCYFILSSIIPCSRCSLVKKKKTLKKIQLRPTVGCSTAVEIASSFCLQQRFCLTPSCPDEDCRVFCPFGSIPDGAAQHNHYVWIGQGAGLILERTHGNLWSPERRILPAQHMELMVLSQSSSVRASLDT